MRGVVLHKPRKIAYIERKEHAALSSCSKQLLYIRCVSPHPTG
jgi:hypothetical protein